MQMKPVIKRHGWFFALIVLWLALARAKYAPGSSPASTPVVSLAKNWPAVASVSETPESLPWPTTAATVSPTYTPAPSPTATEMPSPTYTPAPSPTTTETPSPTVAPEPTAMPEPTDTPQLTEIPSPTEPPALDTAAMPAPPAGNPWHPQVQPAVLANYYPWYDPATWSSGCTSDADQPLPGAYNSDNVAVITRHLAEAQRAGLDGFAVHWYVRGNRTDVNFAQVLNNSPGSFNSTVIFLCHIAGCASQQDVINQLSYIVTTYGTQPRFFRIVGKPVIIFSGMERVPGAGGSHAAAIDIWGYIRSAVDPDHSTWWIAEGLEPGYLQVFDGLYIYKIDHACCPNAAAKAPTWAGWVRDWEQRTGQAKLWVGTVMPGWNDVSSTSPTCTGPDSRVGVISFARDRENGVYYNRTWDAVLPTQPDFILLNSFNEWIEGTYIEPGTKYGELYLQLTAAGVARFKNSR